MRDLPGWACPAEVRAIFTRLGNHVSSPTGYGDQKKIGNHQRNGGKCVPLKDFAYLSDNAKNF